MSAVVLDCSVAMAWCFEDETDAYADRVLDHLASGEAIVPSHWPLEVANVLLVAERGRRLSASDAGRFLALLRRLPVRVDEETAARAPAETLALGRRYRLSSYDAAYLELAIRAGAPLATRDRALRAACKKSRTALFR